MNYIKIPVTIIGTVLFFLLAIGSTSTKYVIKSNPNNAKIYSGKSPSTLKYYATAPYNESGASKGWGSMYFQARKEGYFNSDIQKATVRSGQASLNFSLKAKNEPEPYPVKEYTFTISSNQSDTKIYFGSTPYNLQLYATAPYNKRSTTNPNVWARSYFQARKKGYQDSKVISATRTKNGAELNFILTSEPVYVAKISDKISPTIEILTPEFTVDRGIRRIKSATTKSLELTGLIKDQSQIKHLKINGNVMHLDKHGYFEFYDELKRGQNEYFIVATDIHNNTSRRAISIPFSGEKKSKFKWYKNQKAIVIGIDRYRNANIPALKNAVNDAKALSKIFKHMNINVAEFYNSNATRKNILKALKNIEQTSGTEDSFIFYFAGHGQALSQNNDKKYGYIIPYDAEVDLLSESVIDYDDEAIPLERLRKISHSLKTRHVAVLLDSCFSGLAMTQRSFSPPKVNSAYYKNIMGRKAIYFLTAGDDQPVSDGSGHSPFTKAIIEALENKAIDIDDSDGYARFSQLAGYVKEKVEKATGGDQRPQFENISHQDGDYIFKFSGD